jgi:outer membrane protein assembly factor BamB
MLTLMWSAASVSAQDDEDAPAEDAAPPVVQQASTDGQTIYTVPQLKLAWEAQAVINVSRDKVAHIATDENAIFVQSSAGVVTVFDAETGRQFWSAQVGRNDEVAMKATSDSEMVAIVVGPVVHAFDKFNGNKMFSYRLPHQATGHPLITRREITTGARIEVSRSIFVPIADKSLVAYDVLNLQYIARRGALRPGVSRALDWRFASGELVQFAPVAGEERLAFATAMGNIHVVDMTGAAKGKSRFQFLMNSRTTAPLVVATRDDEEYLLAACDNNRLFCIAMKTDGSMLWTIPLSRPVSQPITVVDDEVFVVANDGELLKFGLKSGLPVTVSDGVSAMASQTEGGTGQLPAYGAAVEMRCEGSLAFEPIQVMNRSTGQAVNVVVMDLSTSPHGLAFAADDENVPQIRIPQKSYSRTSVKNVTLSDDRKQLTVEFTDFNPEELFEFYADLEHPEIPSWKLTHKHLVGTRIKALVSPVRASAVASLKPSGQIEPFPPRTIIGRFSELTRPWKQMGVKSLVAVTGNAAYYVDRNDRVVSVSREHGGNPFTTATREYSIHINNSLTDRIYLCTASGRMACFTESRIELGTLPVPSPAGLSWIVYPKTALAPDFAEYHQNPGLRPIEANVPSSDPAPPAGDSGADAEMP